MDITVITFNIHNSPALIQNIDSILNGASNELVFITLQEVFNPFGEYTRLISACKKKYPEHNIIYERLWGLCTVIITKKRLTHKVKLGLGWFGIPTKGFIAVQVENVLMIGCHLLAGENKMKGRMKMIDYIFKTTENYFQGVDAVIFAGDMNFRIKKNETARNIITNLRTKNDDETIAKLLKSSDDVIFKSKYSDFVEHGISFPPTYKYIVNTTKYEKNRMPSWCDRVYFKTNKRIELLEYQMLDILISDHRPVVAKVKIHLDEESDYKIKKNVVLSYTLMFKILITKLLCFFYKYMFTIVFVILITILLIYIMKEINKSRQ